MAKRKDDVAVLRCEGCGLGVIEAMPDDLGLFYDDSYYISERFDQAVGYTDYQLMAEHGLSWAAELVCRLKDGGKILDIGCADGNLLKRLPGTFDPHGIEVNERMLAQAADSGIDIIGRDLLDPGILERYAQQFDIVTAIAVFEHLRDFRRGFEVALAMVKRDGFLLFEVPYVSDDYQNSVWFESSLEHVFYPSRDSLRLLIEGLGFQLVGGEVNIRDFASNFIGIVFHDPALEKRIKELFALLTATEGRIPDRKLRIARQNLMLIHAAQSTPELLVGLPDLARSSVDAPLLHRIEQLWTSDLRRLASSRSEYAALAESYATLSATYSSSEKNIKLERQELVKQINNLAYKLRCFSEEKSAIAMDGERLAGYVSLLEESYADLRRAAQAEKTSKELEVANLKESVRALEDQVSALKGEIDLILRSTTWRSTSILRRLGHRFPQLAHATRRALKLIKWSANFELRQRLSEAIAARRKFREQELAAIETPLPKLVFDERTCFHGYVEAASDETEEWPCDRPLVSVVVVSFNYGHFVEEAVDSVLAQTFGDIEVIVVDGGSTDPASRERTLALKRPKTTVVAQTESHQVGANRNFGISKARGKYICCLDADDLLKPTYIEKAVFLLETYGYDVVSCAMQQFGSTDERVCILDEPQLADMLEGNHVLTCAVFRRSLWEKAGGYRDTDRTVTGHVYEDWLFWARLAAMGARIHNMSNEHLFLYRRHGPSLSTQPDMLPMAIHRKLIRQAVGDLVTPAALKNSRLAAAADRRPGDPLTNFLGRASSQRAPAILLALPFTIIGGAERLLSGIVAHLAKERWRVTVVTSIDPGHEHGDSTSWFEGATAEIFHLPRFLAADRWSDFVSYLIASREINVVWIAGSAFMYNLLPVIRAKFPSIRVADLLFNTVGHTNNNRKYAKFIDVNFVENREVLQFLLDAGESRDRVLQISSGIDLQEYLPRSRDASVVRLLNAAPEELIVGFSGRWSDEKDPLAFVEIARKLAHLPIHFVMTGAGVLRSKIESALATASLGDRFHLIGEVEDVRSWITSYDVLVLPSRFDGRPVVVLEALAQGVPVIASAVGGLPELIHDGKNGFLCQPRMIGDFADRIAKLALNRELLKQMKEAARHSAEQNFDARRMLSRYEQGLKDLIRHGSSLAG